MQKLVLSTLFITFLCLNLNAQKGNSFGIKAGLNYNANDESGTENYRSSFLFDFYSLVQMGRFDI